RAARRGRDAALPPACVLPALRRLRLPRRRLWPATDAVRGATAPRRRRPGRDQRGVGRVFRDFTLPCGFLYGCAGPFPPMRVCHVTGGLGGAAAWLDVRRIRPGKRDQLLRALRRDEHPRRFRWGVANAVALAEASPRIPGPVIALAKVLTGRGSPVLAAVGVSLFGDNVSGFIYAIVAHAVVVCGVAALAVALPPYFVNGWWRRGKSEEQLAAMRALEPAYRRKFVPVRRLLRCGPAAGLLHRAGPRGELHEGVEWGFRRPRRHHACALAVPLPDAAACAVAGRHGRRCWGGARDAPTLLLNARLADVHGMKSALDHLVRR
ncbi:uncharacterized protein Tco025E_09869, partial [Trypanosoma conorhini]